MYDLSLNIFIGLVICTVLLYMFFVFSHNRKRLPPGPLGIPFIGNVFSVRPSSVLENFRELRRKYGDIFRIKFGSESIIVINGYDNLRNVFLKRGDEFSSRPKAYFFTEVGKNLELEISTCQSLPPDHAYCNTSLEKSDNTKCFEDEILHLQTRNQILQIENADLKTKNKQLVEGNSSLIQKLNNVSVILRTSLIEKITKSDASRLKYPKTTAIIDYTEVYIQQPLNSEAQASTWSNYKSHNTLKALEGIQPNGAFTFVSKGSTLEYAPIYKTIK